MKEMSFKRIIKKENGAITAIVLITVLFFVTILSTAYALISAQRRAQMQSEITVKDVYEKDLNSAQEIYNTLAIQENIVEEQDSQNEIN